LTVTSPLPELAVIVRGAVGSIRSVLSDTVPLPELA
jgi:hypothetical protein